MVCRTPYSTFANQNLSQHLCFLRIRHLESPSHPHFDLDVRMLFVLEARHLRLPRLFRDQSHRTNKAVGPRA